MAHDAATGQAGMNAEFFGLACLAAFNPKLLLVDLILARNQRPRAMFVCFLVGGMGLSLTIGLLDVLVLQVDAVKTQGQVSAQIDLILGIPLLVIGALLAANRLHRRRRRPQPEGSPERTSKLQRWAERVLREPRYWLAVLIGAAVGTPGAAYVAALHNLVTGKSATAVQVVGVLILVLINFTLVLVPFALYLASPQRTLERVKRFDAWLASHERQIAAGVALIAGGYMVITALVRLT